METQQLLLRPVAAAVASPPKVPAASSDAIRAYFLHHDQLLLTLWFVFVCVQWNSIGQTIGMIPATEWRQIGLITEILVGCAFSLDVVFFKRQHGSRLPLYSKTYQFVDYLSGPVALSLDILSLVSSNNLSVIGVILRSCKALTLIYSRRVFSNVQSMIPKVIDMFACLFCVFFFFTYLATYLYAELFAKQHFFNTIGFSFFTMLQIMTLDGWGEIGRHVLAKQSMFSASFFILFVFIMAYFFWNILIGFILDLLRREGGQQSEMINENLECKDDRPPQTNGTKAQAVDKKSMKQQLKKSKLIESLSLGEMSSKLIVGVYLSLIVDSMLQSNLSAITSVYSQMLHLIAGMTFTLQYVVILISKGEVFTLERKHGLMMTLHVLSGPIAFALDIYTLQTSATVGAGGILKYMKVFTVTREMFVGAVMIFPTLVPAFLGIISAIYVLADFALSYLRHVESFWVNFNTSVYTFVQILTLDDWAAKIVKDMLKADAYLSPFVIVAFIFIANYFFLNMMVAISSEVFTKVTTKQFVERHDVVPTKPAGFYDRIPANNQIETLAELNEELALLPTHSLDLVRLAQLQQCNGGRGVSAPKRVITNEVIEKLLEAKHGKEQLDSPIVFSFQGLRVEITQEQLREHIRLNLSCEEVQQKAREKEEEEGDKLTPNKKQQRSVKQNK